MPTADFMCLDGEIVRYPDARIHAFSGVVKYGCGVFEGIRAYWNERSASSSSSAWRSISSACASA